MFRDEIQSLTEQDLFESTLVVADDEPVNRLLIGKYLSSAGFTRVHMAGNGAEALELIESLHPDLLILDIVMPVLDGFEVLATLRASERWADLPILVETALDAPEERSKVFEVGATDLVTKPLNGKELISRVKIHLERGLLLGKLQEFHERLSDDLARAQTMQLALLPSHDDIAHIEGQHGLSIASTFQPCNELGGDIWSLHPIDDHSFAILLADLSGHGVTAAVNSFRLHTALRETNFAGADAGEVLSHLNRRLSGVLPVGQFAAGMCWVFDCAHGRLSYSGAAWPEPVLLPGADGDPIWLDGSGVPIGVDASLSYDAKTVEFTSDSLLLGFSDALVESTNLDGVMLGKETLIDMIAESRDSDKPFLDALMTAFHGRVGGLLDDDLTVVTVNARPS